MNYPKNIEEKLGFDVIKDHLRNLCKGTLGRAMVDQIRFSNVYEKINRLQEQTAEMSSLLERGVQFPEQHFNDASTHLQQAEIEGSLLTEEQFLQIRNSLQTLRQCLLVIDGLEEQSYPRLKELADQVGLSTHIFYRIDEVIDENGKVRDTASPKLNALRKSIIDQQTQLRRRLDSILRQAKANGFTHDDANITIRNGRLVIPVFAEAKRKLKGFIHDESATGQTVFMEPAEVLETNNQIRELIFEEQREIGRILFELTELMRPHLYDIRKGYHFLGLIDFIRAKARFGLKLNCTFPGSRPYPMIHLLQARHPILYLLHEAQKLKTVPLNMVLEPGTHIVVISGPNAGGKSIALKTVGLIQYMFQCGVPVPVGLGTEMGVFDQILTDIGDEQSIENDLSTYSSHLASMRLFMQKANAKTLFLIDEFGTGTEPQYGGAMAEAILEQLVYKKAFGVVNTHYANLKTFAGKTKGVTNAAMRFDIKSMEPLFELELGQPGSSFAFEIAQKMGIPNTVLASARKKIGIKQVNFDKLLAEVEQEKKEYAARNAELKAHEAHLKRLVHDYDKLKRQLDEQKKSLMTEARKEAKALLTEANKMIENTIRKIREANAEKTATRKARVELEQYMAEKIEAPDHEMEDVKPIYAPEVAKDEKPEKLPTGPLKVGDFVAIKGMDSVGVITAQSSKDFEVSIGDLKSYIKADRLSRISKKMYIERSKPEQPTSKGFKGIDLTEKMMQFDNQLDIRGVRAADAISMVEAALDEAILLGQKELRIVHGKGDGILRNVVRDLLKKYKQVKGMKDEHADRGGAGVTLVALD
jgi:DNA mismatch repair protein MutS2